MKEFIKNLLAVDEKKLSTLIVVLFICMGIGIYMTMTTGDIPENLRIIILTLITVIGVENVVPDIFRK